MKNLHTFQPPAKLTAISITIGGKRYSSFMMLNEIKPVVTEEQLRKAFPEFRKLTRGDTYSHG